jgi:acetoacetyl-CoA synthetase
MHADVEILWRPEPATVEVSRIGAYLRWLESHCDLRFTDYQDLWRWSVSDLSSFWGSIWRFFDVQADAPASEVLSTDAMPGAKWFPGARLNYARQALRGAPEDVVLVALSQTRGRIEMTRGELTDEVARLRTGLQALGVVEGDRVAGYLPSLPETVAAFLATASLGATWTACPPEFGPRSVIDRLGQLEPKVLLAIDGYRYGERVVDRGEEVRQLLGALPSVEHLVVLPYLDPQAEPPPGAIGWAQLRAEKGPLEFAAVGFDHPLWVLFSSGTTGPPKGIVHGHGGILLEHLKAVGLHYDVGAGDRFLWFSTTGWMVWNFTVSALLTGGAVVVFDGDPVQPDHSTLWRAAAANGVTQMGVSPAFLTACARAGLKPREEVSLDRVRTLIVSGASLSPAGYRWVYDNVSANVQLAEGSGGTDVCSGFLGTSPMSPVKLGKMAGCWLGVDAHAFDTGGRPVVEELGELVVTQPMPSMPVALWNDPSGERYRAAYFDTFPGVWRHGDWVRFSRDGTATITGRSDATLNRGGVRLGTAEFYACIEGLAEIEDSLVVHLEDEAGGPGQLYAFVALAPGGEIEHARARIAEALRRELSPRHVPDHILSVPSIPRNAAGKRLEVPVKRILLGADPSLAAAEATLATAGSLEPFVRLAAERREQREAMGDRAQLRDDP